MIRRMKTIGVERVTIDRGVSTAEIVTFVKAFGTGFLARPRSDGAAGAAESPASMLAASSPANRIKLERFGKSSVVLARCTGTEGGPAPDQSAYEPLFASASSILANYRMLLKARRTVPDELARVATVAAKPAAKSTAAKSRHNPGPQSVDKK